ncbi:MAG: AbrB/MazE/SpoVT family DNA-binding domain-containing protein [Terracidiphilus sp.]
MGRLPFLLELLGVMIKVTGDLTMSSASANPKGRIKIPAEARKKLDLNSGDRVGFIENENGEFVHRPKTGSIMNLKGIVKWTGKPVTVEEMDKAISEHIQEDWARFERQRGELLNRCGY